jgi:hypothetical protein
VKLNTYCHLYPKYTYIWSDCLFVFVWRNSPQWARASSFTRFLDHTQRHTTVGRTPLYEWSTRRRDLYLTTHNTHNRQTSMRPVGFEITISAGERPQTYALDGAATGTGIICPDIYLNLRRNIQLIHFIIFHVLSNRMISKAPCFALYHIQQDFSKTENFISMTLCPFTICCFR